MEGKTPPLLQGFSLCKELLAADQGEKRGEKMVGGGGGIVKEKGEYILYIQKMRKFKN